MLKKLQDSLRAFGCDTRGNVVMMVALAVPVIFLAIGGAIDFSRVLALRAELQDAADVASVGAVAVNSQAYKASQSVGAGEIKVGSTQAASIFNSDIMPHQELSAVEINAKVVKSGTVLTSNVNVTANYKTYMLGLFGFSTLKIGVTSQSSATMPPYIDFYLLLDNTPSMGLGATLADISLMEKKAGCAFACHEDDKPGTDNYSIARKWGVTTRIDVVRQATQNMMTTAKNSQTVAGQYRMAIYDFGASAQTIDAQNPVARQVSALTTDLTLSATNAGKIDLMTTPKQNYNNDRQTKFSTVLASVNKAITAPGDGLSAGAPQKVLFFISDGVNDGYDCASSGCRRIAPLDTAQCKAIKDRGIRIAVLYTTYQPVPSDSFFVANVKKFLPPDSNPSQVATAMQACASDGLYFEVSPSQGINEALQALFNKVISVVRIRA